MRDDELRQLLRERNPWWKLIATGADPAGWASRDPVLVGADAVGINYDPPVLGDVAPGGLWVLRGPRRVGKSVVIKRLAERACGDPVWGPGALIYLSVDGFRAQDLRRAFTLGRDLTRAAGEGPRLWLIDEVTSVPYWIPVIKELRDNTSLAFDAVVLTGSSARDLDEARGALGAGRTGVAHPFRLLLPMTFRGYLASTGVVCPLSDAVTPDALQSDAARAWAQSLEPFVDDLDLAWQRFCESGGFPRAVGEHHHRGAVSDEFASDVLAWLAADIEPDGPVESVSRMLDELQRRSGSPFDLLNTAAALGTTREKLRVRIARLVTTFGAFWCPQGDEEGAVVQGGRPKLYLIDPLLAGLPALRDPTFAASDITRVTEAQLGLELARSIDRLHPDRFVEGRAVVHARTGAGNEVDFSPSRMSIGGQSVATVPLEAKWVSRNWRQGALVMRSRYGKGILATKDVVEMSGDVWALPAPIVALLLN